MLSDKRTIFTTWAPYLVAIACTAVTTLLIQYFALDLSLGNVSMLYLLLVIVAAVFLGKGPAVAVSLTSFLAVNWFFVTPKYTFNVSSLSEWLSLCTFLFTAIVTGQLMAQFKYSAYQSQQHQIETAALSDASWAIASQLDTKSSLTEVLQQAKKVIDAKSATVVVIEGSEDRVVVTSDPSNSPSISEESLVLPFNTEEINGYLHLVKREAQTVEPGKLAILKSLGNHAAVILQREKLYKTKSEAAALLEADRLKTALLSMVSHDFRSPLTSIKASVTTLLADGEPLDMETQRTLFQTIEQETDRLNNMVGNILDLSRLEAQAWKPQIEITPVPELISMVLDAFSPDSNKRIRLNLDPSLTEIGVDCVQMTQVIKNLVENGLKYSQAEIEITTSQNGSNVFIDVLDRGRGLGLSEEDLVFEPFYRAPDLKETSVPGVGIGLAVSRGLVEAHGGQLTAENRDGGGARFRITLPTNNGALTS